jgi:hypothetical protein
MTAALTTLQTDLAGVLEDGLGITVLPHVPSQAQAMSGWVRPAGRTDWIDYTSGLATFKKPGVNLSAVLTAPSHDWPERQRWLEETVAAIPAVLLAAGPVAGAKAPMVAQVSAPGLLDGGGGQGLLAVEVFFTPVYLEVT